MLIELDANKIIWGDYVIDWCKMPYGTHQDGCPQCGSPDCPPNSKYYFELIYPPYYFVIREFSKEHYYEVERISQTNRTRSQILIPYLWQPAQERLLVEDAMREMKELGMIDGRILPRPERNYVNIFSTCRLHGIEMEKNPEDIVKLVAMFGKDSRAVERFFE